MECSVSDYKLKLLLLFCVAFFPHFRCPSVVQEPIQKLLYCIKTAEVLQQLLSLKNFLYRMDINCLNLSGSRILPSVWIISSGLRSVLRSLFFLLSRIFSIYIQFNLFLHFWIIFCLHYQDILITFGASHSSEFYFNLNHHSGN